MIIDIHTHTYPDKMAEKTLEILSGKSGTNPYTNGTFQGLKDKMTEAGIDISVLLPVATAAKQSEKLNMYASLTVEKFAETGIFSFGAIHPENDNYKEILNQVKAYGLKGIKLHPDYQDAFFNDIRYKRIISYATELDLAVITHAGQDIGLPDVIHCTPDMAIEVLEEVQPTKLILAHAGGWNMWDEVCDKLCGRPVYLDTAFSYGDISYKAGVPHRWKLMEKTTFEKLIKLHGSDKILFGTDSPWSDQKESVDGIKGLDISLEEKKNILGEAAQNLIGF